MKFRLRWPWETIDPPAVMAALKMERLWWCPKCGLMYPTRKEQMSFKCPCVMLLQGRAGLVVSFDRTPKHQDVAAPEWVDCLPVYVRAQESYKYVEQP